MLTSTRLNQSIDLVRGMADRTDTDLATPANAARFRSMVLRCSACDQQDACTKLQSETTRLETVPGYCRNADIFA
jgi:hypothetical protein